MQHMNHQLLKTTITRLNTIIKISSRRCDYTTKANKKKPSSYSSLYSIISPLGDPKTSVSPVLDQWLQTHHKKPSFAELQRIIRDLRKRNRFSQALEVSEWVQRKGIYKFTTTELAVQLDLVGKVHGYVCAESYFNNLSEEEKTEKTYGALLHSYVRQNQVEKSLSHLQKMKEKGVALSSVVFNDIMCLYTNTSQTEKVPHVLSKMKENGISPDNLSYRLCINSYGLRSDIEGVEKVLEEMESQPGIVVDWNTYAVVANFYIKAGLKGKAIHILYKAEERLDKNDSVGYNHLISLHARLGNKTEVMRIWGREKNDCKRCINRDYINMLDALVRLGELEEAEKLLVEWESSGNCYDFRVPNVVVLGYIAKGLYEKAELMLEDLMQKGKTVAPKSWIRVVESYVNKGEIKKAVACMKVAPSSRTKSEDWKFHPKTITRILESVGEESSSEDVQTFADSLKNVLPFNRQMYHVLLKSCVRDGKAVDVDVLLNSMRADGIDPDEETNKILSMREDKFEN